MVARTAAAALVGAAAGAGTRQIVSAVVGGGLGGELIVLSSVGLAVIGGFVGTLYALRAPERRLLADAVAVVTLRRR
jgi:hypothetical protein